MNWMTYHSDITGNEMLFDNSNNHKNIQINEEIDKKSNLQ